VPETSPAQAGARASSAGDAARGRGGSARSAEREGEEGAGCDGGQGMVGGIDRGEDKEVQVAYQVGLASGLPCFLTGTR
jgi:hypothetical protein